MIQESNIKGTDNTYDSFIQRMRQHLQERLDFQLERYDIEDLKIDKSDFSERYIILPSLKRTAYSGHNIESPEVRYYSRLVRPPQIMCRSPVEEHDLLRDPLEPKTKRICLDTIRLFNKAPYVKPVNMKVPEINKRPQIYHQFLQTVSESLSDKENI